MKLFLKHLSRLIAISLLLTSNFSQAILIDEGIYTGTDVGDIDTLISTAHKNTIGTFGNGNGNGKTAELNWANSLIDTDTTFNTKTTDVVFYATDVDNVYAFSLAASDYFLLKKAQFSALYENLSNSNWGVFDASILDPGFKLSAKKIDSTTTISHVTEFGSASVSIPEPKTAGILAFSVIGFLLMRRRKTY